MSMLKIIVIGQDLLSIGQLKTNQAFDRYQVLEYTSGFDNTIHLLNKMNSQIDLVIIEMKHGDSGAGKLFDLIRYKYQVPVIMLASHNGDVFDGSTQKPEPVAFLQRPFDDKDLEKAVELSIKNFAHQNDFPALREKGYVFKDSFVVKAHSEYVKIKFEEIRFIKAHKNHVQINMADKTYSIPESFEELKKWLGFPYLMHCHDSCLVNIRHVDKFEDHYLFTSDVKIPVSPEYRRQIFKKFKIFKSGEDS